MPWSATHRTAYFLPFHSALGSLPHRLQSFKRPRSRAQLSRHQQRPDIAIPSTSAITALYPLWSTSLVCWSSIAVSLPQPPLHPDHGVAKNPELNIYKFLSLLYTIRHLPLTLSTRSTWMDMTSSQLRTKRSAHMLPRHMNLEQIPQTNRLQVLHRQLVNL